jgi:hypothetical protein
MQADLENVIKFKAMLPSSRSSELTATFIITQYGEPFLQQGSRT